MRVGLFTDTYCPQVNGVATSTRMLMERLAAAGHEVFIVTTTDPDAAASTQWEEGGLIRVPSLPIMDARRFAYPAAAHLGRIKRLDLDVIHTQTEFSVGFLGQVAARRFGISLVHSMHTLYEDYTHYVTRSRRLEPLVRRAAQRWTRVFADRADRVIAPTQKVAELMRQYGVVNQISVVPTGVELARFAPGLTQPEDLAALRKQHGIGEAEKVIVYVGRLSAEKNIGELLAAMAVYLPDHEDVKLLLVGDGPGREDFGEAARDYGLTGRVVFAGEQPWERVAGYYGLADVFVSASQSETQGLTYSEALASGLPVVARADPCLDGVLESGRNGYAFADAQEMFAALDAVLFDPENRRRLSRGAEQSMVRFSVEGFASSVEAIYNEVRFGAFLPCALPV
jgi:1,2-diacylglycerol 3-alpha-glucosyltransferase